jgi:MYXO-CTERM domain-containing protein
LWEALQADPRWRSAFDTAAQATWGLSWDEAFLEYSTWMAFACANDDGRWVENGTSCLAELSVPIETVAPGTAFPVVHDAARDTATYAAIDDAGTIEVACDALGAGQRLGVRLVALDGGDPTTESDAWADIGQPLSVAVDTTDTALIVFASTGTRGIETNCTATVTPIEEPEPEGCSCATSSGPPPHALLLALAYLTRRSERRLRTRSPVVGGVIARYRGRGSNG